jgi:hypothetical protein
MSQLFTYQALVFYLVGIAAMFAHALKMMAKGELPCSFIEWGTQNPAKTAWAHMSCLGSIAALILSGQIYDINAGAHILTAFGAGFIADATLNGVNNANSSAG